MRNGIFLIGRKSLVIAITVATAVAMTAACTTMPRESDAEMASSWQPEKTEPAIEAAKAWLTLVDSGNADAAWDEATALFQSSVTKAQWQADMAKTRQPLGAVKLRAITSANYETSLPGVPDGEYVVIVFESDFENDADVIETVTPAFEAGRWKISGYYID